MRLGREVDDRLAAAGGRDDRVGVGDVAVVELVLDAGEVLRVAGVGELVEHDDLVAGRARRRTKCEPMKPAPPVTRTRIARTLDEQGDAAAAETAGDSARFGHRRRGSWRPAQRRRARHSRRPSRQCGSSGAPRSERSTEYAGRGALAPNSAVEIRRTRQSSPASAKIASANSAQVHSPGRREVVDAERPPGDLLRGRREVAGVGRAAALVVDDGDLVALGAEAQHRPDEVVADRPEEPRGAHDPGPLAGRRLAVELRAAVGAERMGRVGLEVGLALGAVEDVVAREVDERRAERGDVLRPADVRRRRTLRVVLGAVDVGPGGGVQDELEPWPIRLGRRRADVPALPGQGDRLRVAARRAPARAGRPRR